MLKMLKWIMLKNAYSISLFHGTFSQWQNFSIFQDISGTKQSGPHFQNYRPKFLIYMTLGYHQIFHDFTSFLRASELGYKQTPSPIRMEDCPPRAIWHKTHLWHYWMPHIFRFYSILSKNSRQNRSFLT